MKQALLYKKIGDKKVQCNLCAFNCILKEGDVGVCKVRKNIKGELYSLNYDKIAAFNADPIEKKPLYHILPSSTSLSIATMGCNFKCQFCQNYTLSQVQDENSIMGENISPEDIVKAALKTGSKSIAYTYSEPTIFFELMYETAKLAKENNIKNVMVTNGYMSKEALEMISTYLDAANIDLKAFSENFYKKYCNSTLEPVLNTIKRMKDNGIWVELTTLVIEGLNTDEEEMKKIISFILNLDKNIPWHVSRFFPVYKLNNFPITDTKTIFKFLETGKHMGLNYLYGGNINTDDWNNTYCPICKSILIKRNGYHTKIMNLSEGKCANCGELIPGVWK